MGWNEGRRREGGGEIISCMGVDIRPYVSPSLQHRDGARRVAPTERTLLARGWCVVIPWWYCELVCCAGVGGGGVGLGLVAVGVFTLGLVAMVMGIVGVGGVVLGVVELALGFL